MASPLDVYLAPGVGSGAVTLHNVNAGEISATSRDAINGAQMHQLGSNIASALGGGASYANGTFTAPSYNVQGGSYSNVGGALGALDNAINNLSQQNTINSNAITNLFRAQQMLSQQVETNRKIAASGAASAIAAAQIRYPDAPGRLTVGVGGGLYDKASAFAVGVGGTSANGRWRYNGAVTYAPQTRNVGVGVGLSFTW